MSKAANHIKARNEDGKRYIRCSKCKEEIELEIDEEAMEGMMDQMNQFTTKHLKCKGNK